MLMKAKLEKRFTLSQEVGVVLSVLGVFLLLVEVWFVLAS